MSLTLKSAMHFRKLSTATFVIFGMSILSLILFPETLPVRSSAVDTPTVTPSITIGGNGSIDFSVTPGTFSTGSASITVATTNYTGYNLTIAPSTGNSTELVNTSNPNVTIPTITLPSGEDSITSNSFATPSYGYSLDQTNYKPVSSGTTIKQTTIGNNVTDTFNLTIGAKTATTTPSGLYEKTFTLTATTNPASYSVTYDKNTTDTVNNLPASNDGTLSGSLFYLSTTAPTRSGYSFLGWDTDQNALTPTYASGAPYNLDLETNNTVTFYAIWQKNCPGICYDGNNDDGTGTMPDQTVSDLSSDQTLIGNNFSRSGYGFAGWSEDENAYTHLTDNDQTNDPTIYGPMETVTMPGHTINLYAVWVPAETETINNVETPVYLQGWNGCSSLDPNEVIALTDNRDNNVYTIARIVDNASSPTYSQCWMIENLRLDVTNSNITYTNNNTNHPASSFLYQKDAFISGSPTWQTCQADSVVCDDQLSYSLANINRSNTASYNTNNQTSSWYSYGGMYNWFTTTAGNGLYGMSTSNTNVAGDICPSGWHLPSGKDTTGEYGKLDIALGGTGAYQNTSVASNRWRTYPVNFLYSGIYYGSSVSNRGSYGNYWGSAAISSSNGYVLGFSSSGVNPGMSNGRKYYGQAVRCLAGNAGYHIMYNSNNGIGYSDSQLLETTPNGNTEYTLTASNFSRTGYGFAGWSTVQLDPTSNSFASDLATATTNNQVYGPNAQIKPSSSDFDSNLDLMLYAIWVPVVKDSNNNDLTFQTTNLLATTLSDNSTLDSKPQGYITALKDTRDNEIYAVAKLADGNYWMIENMRLDLSNSNTTITTSNTNHPTQAFITDINDNYKGKSNDQNTTLWKTCKTIESNCIDQTSFAINNLNRESVTPIATTPIYDYQDYGWRSYGIYYNWYTATGGTGTYSKTSGVTDGDLCPAGWHLPQGGSGTGTRGGNTSGGFYYLNYKLNNDSSTTNATASNSLREYPNNFLYSGFYSGSSADSRGNNGYYWSSTAYNLDRGYVLNFYRSGVYPAGNVNKYLGQAVRCLASTSESFTMTYDANGGTGGPASDSGSSNTRSYDFTISSTTPTRSGLSFAGWSLDANASVAEYQPGQTYTFYQPFTTLYAVWVPEVIIHFNGSGGTGSMSDQGVPSATTRTLRSNAFSKSGYNFIGWTTTQGSTNVEYLDQASYTAPNVTPPGPLEVTLYAVWGRSRTIAYNPNNTDATASGTMGNQTGIYEYGQATLRAPNFARPGFGFAGWSTDPSAQPGGSSTIYGPNEAITVPGYDSNSTLTLYAVWVAKDTTYTLQTFGANNRCSTLSTSDVIALEDSRDGNVYTVGKLADGNCWMMENLRLNPSTAVDGSNNSTIAADNTHSPTTTFLDTDITNILNGIDTSPWKTCTSFNSSACTNQISYKTANIINITTSPNPSGTSATSPWYSYGVAYNWYTATAGNGTYSMGSADGAMPGDICPTGWHLPYGGSDTGAQGGNTSGGFYYLNYKLNNDSNVTDATASNIIRAYPNNFIYSGHYSGSDVSGRGSRGRYWSSTANTNANSYGLSFDSSLVDLSTNFYYKYYGLAVRCVTGN